LSTLHRIMVAVALVAVISGTAYSLGLFNRPPKAAFTYRTPARTLKYIAPTDRDLIIFTNESTDPETPLEKMICDWYVRYNQTGDWKHLNSSTHHWGRLPVSNGKGHEIKLVVSDGEKEDSTIAVLPLDPYKLPQYRVIRLGIPTKRVTYFIGRHFSGGWGAPPATEEMKESLAVIRDELGCNAISLEGDYEDVMVECAEIAITMRFKEITLVPRYSKKAPGIDIHIDEHVERTIAFSKKAEELRRKSDSIILSIGTELTWTVQGIAPGLTKEERLKNMEGRTGDDYPPELRDKLNSYLKQIIDEVRKGFKGRVTYAASVAERFAVQWSELGFDMVAPHLYLWDSPQALTVPGEKWILITVERMRILARGRPFYVSEFGCQTFEGASKLEIEYNGTQAHSQEEQAHNIVNSVNAFEKARIDGINLWAFLYKDVPDAESYGILKWERNSVQRRKLGFYAYQSFVVAA